MTESHNKRHSMPITQKNSMNNDMIMSATSIK